MAKYCGMIGYAEQVDRGDGVFVETIVERIAYGDVIRNMKRDEPGAGLNDDLKLQNEISIVADPYAWQHFHLLRYVTFMGARWKVSSVEEAYPRLNLSIGGVYNGTGPAPETPEGPGGDSGGEEGVFPAPGDGEDDLPVDSV